ncbi:MAG: hypothetical protein FWD78_06635 [Treponema sp.]|nr:hypothetical protein [Treponema sp.]
MTIKERWNAAIHFQPVDRLGFWPKLDKAYSNRWGRNAQEWHNEFGTEHPEGIGNVYKETRKKTGYREIKNDHELINIYQTTGGELRQVQRFDDGSQAWHPVEFPIHTKADIEAMTGWYADDSIEFDKEAYERAKTQYNKIGQSAYTTSGIGHSPLQHFVERLAGIERAHYLLADYPDEVHELFAVFHEYNLKRIKFETEHSPAESLVLVENTSTTTISPSQYQSLSFSGIKEYCDIAKAGGKDIMIHMCGHLKLLLPYLAKLGASSFEAFTSPPLGATTLLDGRSACPDVCLIGGTNANVWLWPAGKIIEYIEQQLEALPSHRGIIMSSAGVMPPACAPETIKAVKQWLDGYTPKLRQ